MAAYHSIRLTVFVSLFTVTHLEKVSLGNRNFTVIQFDLISDNVTNLVLMHNRLDKIDEFLHFPRLEKLWLGWNLLTVFPNLAPVGSTLSHLGIPYNRLRIIPAERLNALFNLVFLNISYNYLSQIPDAAAPLNSLAYFYISHNSFTTFPLMNTRDKSLVKFDISYNRLDRVDLFAFRHPRTKEIQVELHGNVNLTKLPNLGFWNLKYIDLTMMSFHCSCEIAWIKTVEATGITVKIDTTPCALPQHLVGRNWTGLGLSDLVCDDQPFQSHHFRQIGPYFSGRPVPVNQLYGESRLGCAIQCTSTRGCLAYGYSAANGNQTSACFLTGDGPEITVSNYPALVWYMP